MPVDIGDLRYDRTVTHGFASHFTDGFASSLVDYARGKYPIDFQYRKDPKTQRQWATLYVGLTAVLNVEEAGSKGLRLKVHPAYSTRKHGWDAAWETPAAPDEWSARWRGVENYLERAIPTIVKAGRYVTAEGIVQASVSGFLGGTDRAVLDREVAPHFRDEATKAAIRAPYNQQLKDALLKRISTPAPGRPFGMECDALAIDSDGRLIAIEIKPGNVSSLAWVAAQATMYARVLQHWIDYDPTWRATVTRSYEQRRELGLVPPEFVLPELKQVVVPAVAFQRVAKQLYVDQMYAVQKALIAEGAGDPGLVFYAVAPSGRLDVHEKD